MAVSMYDLSVASFSRTLQSLPAFSTRPSRTRRRRSSMARCSRSAAVPGHVPALAPGAGRLRFRQGLLGPPRRRSKCRKYEEHETTLEN